ncbi:FKBP-type peptidyl-prolyl cis-trans isomerase [Lichenicoccus sp.]|uniref:FKBP-type peptidyl-prolyl cis-trans isomerase n=1 Tax=Lichenicoccus sp. TaxID=2781899 RepID=UPI003D0DBF66
MCIDDRREPHSRSVRPWLSSGLLAMVAALAFSLSGSLSHAAHAAEPGAAFLARMAREPGVTTLPSGLEYKVLKSGDPSGAHPSPGDELVLNYDGTLPDGATFDSTDQQGGMARLPFQGLIPGWMQALKLMRPGDEWMLYIPSQLGYGAKGAGPIPPNSPLVFRIDLVAVHHNG